MSLDAMAVLPPALPTANMVHSVSDQHSTCTTFVWFLLCSILICFLDEQHAMKSCLVRISATTSAIANGIPPDKCWCSMQTRTLTASVQILPNCLFTYHLDILATDSVGNNATDRSHVPQYVTVAPLTQTPGCPTSNN